MSPSAFETSLLDEALRHESPEVRHSVADSLACYFHNTGYALEGITEANDAHWFARNIWCAENNASNREWELVSAECRARYLVISRAVIAALPAFQMRVAHRLIELSKVTRDIERAMRVKQPQPE